MTIMNISLPEALKTFVDEQVEGGSYGTSSDYLSDLIRRDQDLKRLRQLLFDGAASGRTSPVDDAYFKELKALAHTG